MQIRKDEGSKFVSSQVQAYCSFALCNLLNFIITMELRAHTYSYICLLCE